MFVLIFLILKISFYILYSHWLFKKKGAWKLSLTKIFTLFSQSNLRIFRQLYLLFPVKLDDNLLILHFIQVKFQNFLWILHYFSVKWRLWAHWGGRMILKSLRTAYFHFPHTLKAKCSLTDVFPCVFARRGNWAPLKLCQWWFCNFCVFGIFPLPTHFEGKI